jgi:hypothetical protein
MSLSDYPVVSSREEYELVLSELRRVMNLSARMPDTPFLSEEGTDSFCQFTRFRGGSFGPFLGALATQYHDESVSGAALEPEFYTDREDRNGTFAAFHISASQIAEQYWRALTYERNDNPADCMYFQSDVLCVAGSSGSWAIWGERSIGVAIVRTAGSDLSWIHDSDWFVPPTDAIRAFIEPEFNLQPLSEQFRQTFLRNVRPFGGYEE